MQGRSPPDGAHNLHARAFAVGAFDVHDFIALAHAQIDRLLDQLVQLAHGGQCRVSDIQTAFDQIAQFQQADAQAVAARFRTVNKSARGQVIQNPVGC